MILRLIIALFICSETMAADLKILSWNVFMLPKPIKFSLQNTRAEAMPRQISGSGYDLMFFQEAFTPNFREEMSSQLKKEYPYSYYLNKKKFIFPVFGSGVYVMSRHPFKVLDQVFYKKCAGADCLAAKGAVLVEVQLPTGKKVQFVNTHLQAGDKYGSIRLAQLSQVKEMLNKHLQPHVPQILIGDLNIDVKEPEFHQGMDIMDMSHTELEGPILTTTGRVNECYKNPGLYKKWVDHFWVNNDTWLEHSSMVVRPFDFKYKQMFCPTSDHHAIEATFAFKN